MTTSGHRDLVKWRMGPLAGALWLVATVHAADAPLIYSCVDATGKRLTSDRPIAECSAREQRVLNSDGSVKRVLPPTPTASERAEIEAREREAATERAVKQDAIRRDRNLMARYPNEAAHRKARDAALGDVSMAMRQSQARIVSLTAERKPLLAEAEFYAGKPIPAKLRSQFDANDAAVAAQRALLQNQQVEAVRINSLYDADLDRLKKLWAGAPPGFADSAPAAAGPAAPLPVAGLKPAASASAAR